MTDQSKRDTLTLLGIGAAGVMLSGAAEARLRKPAVRGSMVGGREPKTLPFDPAAGTTTLLCARQGPPLCVGTADGGAWPPARLRR